MASADLWFAEKANKSGDSSHLREIFKCEISINLKAPLTVASMGVEGHGEKHHFSEVELFLEMLVTTRMTLLF